MAVLEDGLAQVEKEARKYSREDFEFGKILGEGSYSTVKMITLSNPYTTMFNVDVMNYILLCVCVCVRVRRVFSVKNCLANYPAKFVV